MQADLDGIMVDYEPASMSNFSVYPAWLRVVGDALRKRGKKMGANVAGWGVLQNYQAFAEVAKLDLFASMDCTRPTTACLTDLPVCLSY
eukprot:COSAG05_NODE_907_length_6645_cov_18.681638_3_plen_89_part_00